MIVTPVITRIFQEGESLFHFITEHVAELPERSVLVVTSKIVALAEREVRTVASPDERVQLIREESEAALETKWTWLTLKDGMLMASAGIDDSNADGKTILLPRNSMKTAALLRASLQSHYGITNLGVIITDSRTLPLRAGVTGVALGYAGFFGVKDYRGTPDIFGRELKMTRTNYPDGLAAAAVMLMGEGAERQPLACITDVDLPFTNEPVGDELLIPVEDDIYRPLMETLLNEKRVNP